MTPVYELSGLPVKLNDEFVIYNGKDFACKNPLFSSTKGFTLLDILHGIFWELSFFGSTADREKMATNLHKQVEDIKSGKVKCIPMEEIKEKFKAKKKNKK
jgi:hypothetical protein